MESLIAPLLSVRAWRTAACLIGGVALGFLVAAVVAPLPGLIVALVSIGLGFLWEGSDGKGVAAFAVEPSPPMSRSVAFLGMAFIGVFPGGFLAGILGAIWMAVVIVVFAACACVAWNVRVRRPRERIRTIAFLTTGFLTGLIGLDLVASLLGHNAF